MRPADGSYVTYSLRAPLEGTTLASRRAPAPALVLPFESFATVERQLVAVEGGAMRVGDSRTPGGGHYGDANVALTEAQLERGVSVGRDAKARLRCFLAEAERRAITVAALGGSVTSGLAFGTFTGNDHARSHWLYHRKFASWLARTWPVTNANARNTSYNAGVPAVGPAFAALCLHALLPPAVDLVLIEYATNMQGEEDARWLEVLLRKLLAPPSRVAVLAVSSLKLSGVRGASDGGSTPSESFDNTCLDEQRLCESYGGQGAHGERLKRASRAERVVAALYQHYAVPHVSLRRAVGEELGTPPYVLTNFAKDCAHPNP